MCSGWQLGRLYEGKQRAFSGVARSIAGLGVAGSVRSVDRHLSVWLGDRTRVVSVVVRG